MCIKPSQHGFYELQSITSQVHLDSKPLPKSFYIECKITAWTHMGLKQIQHGFYELQAITSQVHLDFKPLPKSWYIESRIIAWGLYGLETNSAWIL